jgi:hypothetical protein
MNNSLLLWLNLLGFFFVLLGCVAEAIGLPN